MRPSPLPLPGWAYLLIMLFVLVGVFAECSQEQECHERGGILVEQLTSYVCVGVR